MRAARFALLLLLLTWMTVVNCGCPALMIPGLAYSGYQAIEEKKTGTAADQESTKPATKSDSSKRSSDDNFE